MVSYGVGGLAVLTLSIGLALIIHGAGVIKFDISYIPSWIFGPFGAYTLIYGIVHRKDPLYYLIWGTLMLAIALTSILHAIINPLIIIGATLIMIVLLVSIARRRVRR